MKNKLIISVAGVRGVYPEPLSPEKAYNFGRAFGLYTKEKRVFVARDTRVSGTVLKLSLMSGLTASGKDIIDLDIASTPFLTFTVEKTKGAAGVMISASHNPEEYNGLKFVSNKGTFLNNSEGSQFLSLYDKISFKKIKCNPGKIIDSNTAAYREKYFQSIYDLIDTGAVKSRNFNVAVDVCQGAGALETISFLDGLNCRAEIINSGPLGVFSHNPEPLPENLKKLSEKISEGGFDAGFAQDPDADRLALVCEDGTIPGEEITLAIAIKAVLEKKKGPVVINLSTSDLSEFAAGKAGVKVFRTKIGEVNVVEKMKKTGAVIGGEGNGGVIFPPVHFGRDSFVGMALILEYLARRDRKLSEVVADFPAYCLIKKKIALKGNRGENIMEKLQQSFSEEESVNLEDGIKIIRRDGWIHIRPSGTEPLIRVYVEGLNKKIANKYLSEVTGIISSM